ncbi:MAG: hypothetical protein ACI4XC_09270 [Eubacterium sp.]
MKKLEKISTILIFVGFGISIFSVAFLDGNEIVGFAGLIIALCSAFVNICIRDKRKKSNNKPDDETNIKTVTTTKMSGEDIKIVEFINDIDTFYDCTTEIIEYKSYSVKERPHTNWIRLNDDKEIEKALIQYAYVKAYFDEHNSNIIDFRKYNSLAPAWLCDSTFLIINGEELNMSEEKKGKILSLCKENAVTIVFQRKNVFIDVFTSDRYILKSYDISGMADDAATNIVYKLNKVFKWDFISDTVNYLCDSQISLSDLKNRCSQNGSKTTKELTNKDSGWQEFIDGFCQRIKENGLFFENRYSAFSKVYDGIESKPEINWIKLKENADLNDAVDYYIDIKKYIDSYSANRLCIYRDTYYNFHWLYNTTFLVLNDKKSELTDEEKNSLFEKCNENNIYIVKQNHDEFTDLFTSTKYTLICSTIPGMADDAATYALYNLMKIYNEEITREEKISEKILYQLLNYSRSSGVDSAEYIEDISLNQINMQIQLDKSRLYFLSVYVNASNGMIKHFSFDIESASDTHYEFDLNGAELLINRMISVSDDEYASHKSISELMINYMNSFGESSLINLIRGVATAVFHFD